MLVKGGTGEIMGVIIYLGPYPCGGLAMPRFWKAHESVIKFYLKMIQALISVEPFSQPTLIKNVCELLFKNAFISRNLFCYHTRLAYFIYRLLPSLVLLISDI